MEEVASLLDVLQPGESALAVLTDGRNLKLNGDGSGTSGNWVIDPARQVDRFVIYYREGGGEAESCGSGFRAGAWKPGAAESHMAIRDAHPLLILQPSPLRKSRIVPIDGVMRYLAG